VDSVDAVDSVDVFFDLSRNDAADDNTFDALLFTFDISDITDFALDSIFVNAVVTVVAVLVVVVVVCEL